MKRLDFIQICYRDILTSFILDQVKKTLDIL